MTSSLPQEGPAATKPNPYITFDGNAEEAMRFHGEAFGAEPQIMTFKDAGMDLPGEYVQGNNLQASLSGDDAA